MIWPDQWTFDNWMVPAIVLGIIGVIAVVYSYLWQRFSGLVVAGFLMKTVAVILLAICLLEPQTKYQRAEPGANSFVVIADRSQSLQLHDPDNKQSREELLAASLNQEPTWLQQLESDFQLRKYMVDRQLEPVTNFESYTADGSGSQLLAAVKQATQRPGGKPLAGVLLLTDGNATDGDLANQWAVDQDTMVPVYPVVVGNRQAPRDLAIRDVVTSQSNFEAAPATFQVHLNSTGFSGQSVSVRLFNEQDELLDRKEVGDLEDDRPFQVQLRTQQKTPGVAVYRVEVSASRDNRPLSLQNDESTEATLVNNVRSVIVDRGRSPLRILYVSGRPNWELKYLRRAVYDDEELELIPLVRIAKREAKFTFRGREGQDSNSLFRGFENQDDDTTERFDEPVFVPLNKDAVELRSGFPKDRAGLFRYDAIILDDVEAAFFSQDQQTLLQDFASVRGGGVLMLGGQESFSGGGYDKTPIGEMLPVYLNVADESKADHAFDLTREGWLQPWVRIHSTEKEEQQRLKEMPTFHTLNPAGAIKPGATVLAQVTDREDHIFPALVVQPFGRGRTAACMVGDLWRWQLGSELDNDDLLAFWRQAMRWLVSDVPGRLQLEIEDTPSNNSVKQIVVKLFDSQFLALDNADVQVFVTGPDGTELPVSVRPSETQAGQYLANYYSETPGVYRVSVLATTPEDGETLQRESAWVSQPEVEEFSRLTPDFESMEKLAKMTGGELIALDELDSLVNQLPNKKVPIQKTVTELWWHRWQIFVLGIALLVSEWGLRRWKGLP